MLYYDDNVVHNKNISSYLSGKKINKRRERYSLTKKFLNRYFGGFYFQRLKMKEAMVLRKINNILTCKEGEEI